MIFHTLNNLVFGRLLSPEYLRNELWYFMTRKRRIYENFWEENFDTHIKIYMWRNRFLGTNLEIMAFSDLMRINVHIFISLDKITFEFEINHPHNVGIIWIFLRNWRHYEDCKT